jgi:hypothetical protein
MTEAELRSALEQDKIVRLYPERPAPSSAKARAIAAIDEAVHLSRSAGFELVGPLEVGPDRIVAALNSAITYLKDAAEAVQHMGPPDARP